MSKLKIKSVLTVILCLFLLVGVTACDMGGEHNHDISATYSSDAENHWKTCSGCDEKFELAPHSFGEWTLSVAPNADNGGKEKRTCSVCGYSEERDVPRFYHTFEAVNKNPTFGSLTGTLNDDRAYMGKPMGAIEVAANAGYSFVGWFNSATATEPISTETTYAAFTMPDNDVYIEARFTVNTYDFIYSSENTEKGTVSGETASGTKVAYYQSVTVIAEAKTGYAFDGWYNGTEKLSGDAEYTFNMPYNALTLEARFTAQKRTVNFFVDSDLIDSKEVDYNTAAPVDSVNAEKANNEFIDWFTDPGFNSVYNGEAVKTDLDLYAKFNPIAIFYSVRFFDYDGSQLSGNQRIEQGSKPVMPANPEREGYTFDKWTFNDAALPDEFTVTGDMDIVATYTENEYKVRFYRETTAQLGEEYQTQDVKYNQTAIKPQTPSKAGFTFVKWLLNGYEFDFNNPITEELNIYAVWSEIVKPTFTVYFYDDDGGNLIDTQVVEEGGDATAPQIPVKTGKVFKSWSADFTNITANKSVYAIYDDAVLKVTFVYYSSAEGKEAEKIVDVTYGTAAVAPVDTEKAGYTFTGWDKAFTNVTEDMKVTAIYTIKTFTATFHIGTETYATENANYGETYKIPTTPDVPGYSFMGWYDSDEFTELFKFTDAATGNVDVYGKLEEIIIKTYTVKFVDFDNRTISEQTVVEHEAAIAPGNPSRTGYTFKNWDKAFGDVVNDVEIKAQYEKNKYSVTYYEEDGKTVIDVKQVEYLSDASALVVAPDVTGKTFSRWNKDLSSVTKDVEVYAIYIKNAVKVKFIDGDVEIESLRQSVEYGGHASVPSTPVKQGFIFKAWVVADGSDETFDFSTVITAETSVYAKWEAASGVYSVYFKDYDGAVYGNVQRVVAGYTAAEPKAPDITDPEREFDGWYIEGTNNKFDFDTPIYSTVTLVAKTKAKIAG